MNRVLATMAVLAGVIGPVATAPASTPDEAWVGRLIDKITDPGLKWIKVTDADLYFGDLIHVEKIGQDKCAAAFNLRDDRAALSHSSLTFGTDDCDSSLPFYSFEIYFSAHDDSAAEFVTAALRRKLGSPSIERTNSGSGLHEIVWQSGKWRRIVDYDIGDGMCFHILVVYR